MRRVDIAANLLRFLNTDKMLGGKNVTSKKKRKKKKINGRMCTAEINKSRKGVMRSNNLHTKKKRREKCVRRKEKNCASCQVTSA